MERTRFLVVGAGISGLAFVDRLGREADYRIVEREAEPGGYCRTVKRDGFVWDYSGHFFHFRHPEIERDLVGRMRARGEEVLRVRRRSRIHWAGGHVDFPFQKNIHQLPREDFLECLVELHFRERGEASSFKEMLYRRFGRGIAERFLVPYNEKLYATDLDRLDPDAMGRFFPHADEDEILRNFRAPDDTSYNTTFTYPRGGAVQYVEALLDGVDRSRLSLGETVRSIDLRDRVARTDRGEIAFEYLVSSMPFVRLLELCGLSWDPGVFSWNKVLVFNLGFDRKGPREVHWEYFPQRELVFYRVGFYDNIFDEERMSLYVEIGLPNDAPVDDDRIEAFRERVLRDLERAGIVRDHRLLAEHHVLMDPAYVHITRDSEREVGRLKRALGHRGVYSIGRYGSWTYCSIEDNIVEARALADSFRLVGE